MLLPVLWKEAEINPHSLVKRLVKIGENMTTKKFPTGTGNTDGEQRKAMNT